MKDCIFVDKKGIPCSRKAVKEGKCKFCIVHKEYTSLDKASLKRMLKHYEMFSIHMEGLSENP
jgi:hypothetical protein